MRQGTTPTHTFKLPFDAQEVNSIEATYAQHDDRTQQDKVLMRKIIDGSAMDGSKARITLTQTETFDFEADKLGMVQLRAFMKTGAVYGTRVYLFKVEKSLSREVLT